MVSYYLMFPLCKFTWDVSLFVPTIYTPVTFKRHPHLICTKIARHSQLYTTYRHTKEHLGVLNVPKEFFLTRNCIVVVCPWFDSIIEFFGPLVASTMPC